VRTHLKNKQSKRAGGVGQAIELLPSKCEVLSSNPSTAKKKKTFKKHLNKNTLKLGAG
jgi:hypothetical protein